MIRVPTDLEEIAFDLVIGRAAQQLLGPHSGGVGGAT
jgi:hypothetical protein